MTEIEYEGKKYYFSWADIIFFAILCPLIAFAIFIITDYFWIETHWPVLDQTVFLINLFTNMGIDFELVILGNVPIYYTYIIPGKGNIAFETMCTGVQASAIFAGIILVTPHSQDKGANKNIWPRKLLSLGIAAFLFHIVNLFRMVLQLTLYYNGFAWDDIHTPIGAASSFIAAIIILLIHRWIPEFILSIMWISGEIRGFIARKTAKKENVNDIGNLENKEKKSQNVDSKPDNGEKFVEKLNKTKKTLNNKESSNNEKDLIKKD